MEPKADLEMGIKGTGKKVAGSDWVMRPESRLNRICINQNLEDFVLRTGD